MENLIGKKIRIISIDDPYFYLYVGKEGVVERSCVDPYGDTQLWGTWGGIAIYPRVDKFEVIE
jgi:hypothetical protein